MKRMNLCAAVTTVEKKVVADGTADVMVVAGVVAARMREKAVAGAVAVTMREVDAAEAVIVTVSVMEAAVEAVNSREQRVEVIIVRKNVRYAEAVAMMRSVADAVKGVM